MDVLARVCFGDLSLRRGQCKIDKQGDVYLLSLSSIGSRSQGVVSVSSEERPVRAGGSASSRGRRAC